MAYSSRGQLNCSLPLMASALKDEFSWIPNCVAKSGDVAEPSGVACILYQWIQLLRHVGVVDAYVAGTSVVAGQFCLCCMADAD
jgi:hypothetical protein